MPDPAFEYFPDVQPNTPIPLYAGYGFFVDLFGIQPMRGPLRLQKGSRMAPSLTQAGANRTGIFFPTISSIAYVIDAYLRFLVDEDGVHFGNKADQFASVNTDLLTQNQTYQFPDQSGVIALEDSFTKVNAEAFSIQAGQPVALEAGTDCVLASCASITTRAVGVAYAVTGSGNQVLIKTQGRHTLSDWSNVIGSVSLTPDADYYLGEIPGVLTTSPIDLPSYVLQFVGRAVGPQTLLLDLARPIIL